MMRNPETYVKHDTLQRTHSTEVLDEFFSQLDWSPEEEHVLDVGCGPGDITAEILLPRLPPNTSVVSRQLTLRTWQRITDGAVVEVANADLEMKYS